MQILKVCVGAGLSFIVFSVSAQEMSTPYSVYGIGDIDHRIYNHNSGMGYTGLSLKTSLFTSGNNPASLTGLPQSFFMFDVSAASRFVTYSGDKITNDNRTNRDLTIEKLALSARINPFWASGIGFRQVSSVNYAFVNEKTIEGSNSIYHINYSGDGGLNEFYWNNGFVIGRHLSVGVTSSLVAGSINQTGSLSAGQDTMIQTKRRDFYNKTRFDFGAIYTTRLGQNWDLALGGRFANRTELPTSRTITVTDASNSILNDEALQSARLSLPTSYGGGISFTSKKGRTFAADYSYDDWSALGIAGPGWRLVSSQRISAGLEFATFQTDQFRRNLQKRSFRLGAYINNSYLRVQNHQINEYGFTVGITRSLKSTVMYTLSGEAGVRGTTASGLIKENFVRVSFILSFREFLFSQGRKYD